MKSLFVNNRLFVLLGIVTLVFVLAFAFPFLLWVAHGLFSLAVILVLLDLMMLYHPRVSIEGSRNLPRLFSNGDDNEVSLSIVNKSPLKLTLIILEELPQQFQLRNFNRQLILHSGANTTIKYQLKPRERGIYHFGKINIFARTTLGMMERRFQIGQQAEVPVFPSLLQMKHYEIRAIDQLANFRGIKKLRRIGHSYEFEQIKNYVIGDDHRSINWKASGRRATLMVNQYEDERAQQVYNLIDKSRIMRMPFNGLSLLDYAINTSVAISNIILKKHDRAGLITFSDKLGSVIKADSHSGQLNKILQTLHKEKERQVESNYELLYFAVRRLIRRRSLLLLYSNFESEYALDRVLPILRKINKFHLLVVIFFENTEISALIKERADSIEDIYHHTIAHRFLHEKRQMVQKLRKFGIQAVITTPEDLSINTINKYLELKSRGLI